MFVSLSHNRVGEGREISILRLGGGTTPHWYGPSVHKIGTVTINSYIHLVTLLKNAYSQVCYISIVVTVNIPHNTI